MNFADIENVWRSPHNQPTAAQLEEMKMKFVAELHRRQRTLVRFFTLVGAGLTLVSAPLLYHVSGFAPEPSKIDVTREWGALLLLALPWGALFFLVAHYRAHRARTAGGEASIRASVAALLDENGLARRRLRWVAGLHGTVLVILPLVVWQLRAVGKAGDEILVPAFVLWPLIMAGILGGMLYHDRRTLRPRQRELEALLRSYE